MESWLASLVLELTRPRPHGASVLSEHMSITEWSGHWTCSLSGNGFGVGATTLLNGPDVGVGPQNLQVGVSEGSSETIDDAPLMRDLGLGTDTAGDGGDTGGGDNIVLESHNVPSGNSILGLLDSDKGGRGSEDGESTEDESDELLGEHVG